MQYFGIPRPCEIDNNCSTQSTHRITVTKHKPQYDPMLDKTISLRTRLRRSDKIQKDFMSKASYNTGFPMGTFCMGDNTLITKSYVCAAHYSKIQSNSPIPKTWNITTDVLHKGYREA
jgi:hypothetical protein